MSVHDLDRHRALVRASREIPAERPAWDEPRPADWLTPSAHPEQRSSAVESAPVEGPSRAALTLPRLALALLMLAAVSILALALIGAATTWRWATSINGEIL